MASTMYNTTGGYTNILNTSANTTTPIAGVTVDKQFQVFTRIYRIVIPIIFACIIIVGVFGNVLVLTVGYKNRSMKTINNTMVMVLAACDLSFVLICVPTMAIEYASVYFPLGSVWCKIAQYLIYVCACLTIYLLCLMSIDRFCAIVFPLRARWIRTEKNINKAILCIFLFAFVVNIPALLIHEVQFYTFNGESVSSCTNNPYAVLFGTFTVRKLFYANFIVFAYSLPMILLIIMYSSIFASLIKSIKIKRTMTSKSSAPHFRAAAIVLVVEIVFFICWTPIQVILFMYYFVTNAIETDLKFIAILFAANGMSYMNSCLNPILYTFISKEYREKCYTIFKIRQKGRMNVGSERHSSGEVAAPEKSTKTSRISTSSNVSYLSAQL